MGKEGQEVKWKPNRFQRLLFRKSETGWHWTRRADLVYTLAARINRPLGLIGRR